MVTITDARFRRGWSGYDHLLNDSPLTVLIGRTFRSAGEARRAAERAADGTQDRRCALPPIHLAGVVAGKEVEL